MSNTPVKPSFEEFRLLAERGSVVPVYAQLAADFETPLSAFLKLNDGKNAFLFESAESNGASGRWSIVGSEPQGFISSRGKQITVSLKGERQEFTAQNDILEELEKLMEPYRSAEQNEDLPFCGGVVGYLSYDAVRQFEPMVSESPEDDLGLPDAFFVIADRLVVFDHKFRHLYVVGNAFIDEHDSLEGAYEDACGKARGLIAKLDHQLHIPPLNGLVDYEAPEPRSNTTQQEYESMVMAAKEYIAAGDAFQVVPSQRFEVDFNGSPVELYRALRHVNPSPYMFVFQTEEFSLVGSSPEVHVRVIDGRIDIRPIAGTRWRGETKEEDDALAEDLLNDPKERAEHVMLIDLARNDLGRISEHGSVHVDDLMIIERYSHVMHIVSNVTGRLDESRSAYDVLRSTFPAGTVSGAPKIRAMQIINSLEKNKRCSYSGAVGYFGWDGSHDSCIALRTCLLKDGKVFVQAGAGVVADSNPTYEYNETVNKAKGMMRAVGLANTLRCDD